MSRILMNSQSRLILLAAAAMQKSAGETLRLKIKRGADAAYDVSLVGAMKPPS
jgi:hypothetical protein